MLKIISEYIDAADKLLEKKITTLTQDESEDLRMEIEYLRYQISTRVLIPLSTKLANLEQLMDDQEGKQYGKLYNLYIKKYHANPKNYTKGVAETLARKTMKLKSNPYSKAKFSMVEMKNVQSALYQVLKALGGIANALSKKSDRTI